MDNSHDSNKPVAWMWRCKPYCDWPNWSVSLKRPADSGRDGHKRTEGYEDIPLYTSPPTLSLAQRKPLTDEQIDRALDAAKVPELPGGYESVELEIARAIEAAHGIKEST